MLQRLTTWVVILSSSSSCRGNVFRVKNVMSGKRPVIRSTRPLVHTRTLIRATTGYLLSLLFDSRGPSTVTWMVEFAGMWRDGSTTRSSAWIACLQRHNVDIRLRSRRVTADSIRLSRVASRRRHLGRTFCCACRITSLDYCFKIPCTHYAGVAHSTPTSAYVSTVN